MVELPSNAEIATPLHAQKMEQALNLEPLLHYVSDLMNPQYRSVLEGMGRITLVVIVGTTILVPSCVLNYCNSFNSLAPGGYDYSLKLVNFKLISMIIFAVFSVKLVSCECRKTSLIIKSTLVQVMAWCRQATSHYLSQCWPRSLSPYDITRPQCVRFGTSRFHIWVPSYQIVAMAWVNDGAPGC